MPMVSTVFLAEIWGLDVAVPVVAAAPSTALGWLAAPILARPNTAELAVSVMVTGAG